jgi:enterochelin esterase-like enzyme
VAAKAAFLQFIRTELVPFVEATFPSDPQRRILLGHSHGGSFVLYALFNEVPASRLFASYLASDSSIDCMSATVAGWESAYAAANTALPVRLHVSYSANAAATVALVQQVQSRQLHRADAGLADLRRRAHRHDPGRVRRRPDLRARLKDRRAGRSR